MTLTPAQLDEIAKKLLGWKPTRCPIHGTSCPESYYHKPDGTQGHGFLDVESPAAAMLVLEAMGKWCIEQNMTEIRHKLVLEGPIYKSDGYVCCLMTYDTKKGWWLDIHANDDTPAGAIFACAAQLVERM